MKPVLLYFHSGIKHTILWDRSSKGNAFKCIQKAPFTVNVAISGLTAWDIGQHVRVLASTLTPEDP